jgi:hypothetical protein
MVGFDYLGLLAGSRLCKSSLLCLEVELKSFVIGPP